MSRNCIEHLAFEQLGLGGVHERIEVPHALLREQVAFLRECGLDGFRSGRHRGAGARAGGAVQVARQAVDHREEDVIERLLGVRAEQQVVHVRDAELGGEARVDGAALGAFLVELLGGVFGKHDVLRLHAERGEVTGEQRRHRVHVQHARHADAQLRRACFMSSMRRSGGRGEGEARRRVGDIGRFRNTEYRLGRDLDEVGVGLLDLVEVALDRRM